MSRKQITRGYSFDVTFRYFEANGTTPINLPTGENTKFAVKITGQPEVEFSVAVTDHVAVGNLSPEQTLLITRGVGTAYMNLTIGDDKYQRGVFNVRVI